MASAQFALFTTSGPKYALSVEEGAHIIVALNNLLSYHNGFNSSKWYDSGFAFARIEQVNSKRIAFRYIRFTQYCTVSTWETAIGDLVLEDFRTSVPYLRPFLLQGCSWAAVSNGYAWLDYYLLDDNEATPDHQSFECK
ncbi:hypothetical protein SUGI_0572320 [Cryptomeria japonica]|nr:hypothetical protein SUGI_0572320 [Cryptomeria japonica]